jgi:uncharacterized membrane protein YoaK (UPF0700 family)
LRRADGQSPGADRVIGSDIDRTGVRQECKCGAAGERARMANSRFHKVLPGLLATIAGSTDAIGFLGLGGLFTAHITGNLVVLSAYALDREHAPLAVILSVPVFMLVVVLARVLTVALEIFHVPSLQPLLVLQSLLLAGFLALRVTAGARVDLDPSTAVLAGMFGVAAMAVQNALVEISLKGIAATAVMTTNVTRFTLDLAETLVGRDAGRRRKARSAVGHIWPQIMGFVVGCGIGAASEVAFGVWSAVVPVTLAALAAALSFNSTGGADSPETRSRVSSVTAQ